MANSNQRNDGRSDAAPSLEDLKKRAQTAELEAKIKKAQLETEMALAKGRVEQELTVATKRKELLQAVLPKGETKPLEGKIEADEKVGYTAELIAYRVMEKLEDELVNRLSNDLPKLKEELARGAEADLSQRVKPLTEAKVLIVDKLEYAPDDVPLVEVEMHFDFFTKTLGHYKTRNEGLKNEYNERIRSELQLVDPMTAALVVSAVPSVISAFAHVAGYFSTDRSIKGREFELKTEGLVAALAGRLRSAGAAVFLPNLHTLSESTLLNSFKQLQQLALDLKTSKELLSSHVVEPLNQHIEAVKAQVQNLDSELQELDTTPEEQSPDIEQQLQQFKEMLGKEQELLDRAHEAIQGSDTVITAFDNFTKAITSQADGQHPRLMQAVLRENIRERDITYILWLGNLSSGGDAATEDRKLRSDYMAFTGGTAIAYVLATKEGDVVAADVLTGMAVLDHKMSSGPNDVIRHINFRS